MSDKNKLEIRDLIKVESSNIEMVGFNDDTTYVQFKGGAVYSYPETTREEFEQLAYAKSVGGHFAQSYRHKKDYSKLVKTELVKDTKVADAVKVLTEALVADPGYRMSWQANIAMSFKDEYDNDRKLGKNKKDIHRIANTAADNFINMLCRDVEKK